MSYDTSKLKAELSRDEGRRNALYTDTKGNLTGGIGHNFSGKGIQDSVIDFMYQVDVAETEKFLDTKLSWWRTLDPVRQRVVMNMAFNMQDKLLGFKNMLSALQKGDYKKASDEMLNSLWASQVKDRATRLAAGMKDGVM